MFDVHIDMTVPGSEIVVNRVANEDVYVAVRDAFDAAKRQLEDHARK
jgi:ribosome-associated translation inhibitor RaiA